MKFKGKIKKLKNPKKVAFPLLFLLHEIVCQKPTILKVLNKPFHTFKNNQNQVGKKAKVINPLRNKDQGKN